MVGETLPVKGTMIECVANATFTTGSATDSRAGFVVRVTAGLEVSENELR